MKIINYEKLATKINSHIFLRYIIALSCGWIFALALVDAIVDFSLWTFKLLLLPAFAIFIVGVLINERLFEYELYGR